MDQPVRKVGGKIIPMDAPSLKYGQQDCAYQSGSSIHAAILIFHNGSAEMGAKSDQTVTAQLPLGKLRTKQKMGSGEMGEGLSPKNCRRHWSQRSGTQQHNNGSKNLVEMAIIPKHSLGTIMDSKICQQLAFGGEHKNDGNKQGIYNVELSYQAQRFNSKP